MRESIRQMLGGRFRPDRTVQILPVADCPHAYYAVGDIHGRLDLLLKLEHRIRDDIAAFRPREASIVYLGDYIDRGPDSHGVIKHLTTRPPIAQHDVFLRGNHEQVLLDFLAAPAVLDSWRTFGGSETLHSYGIRISLARPEGAAQDLRDQLEAALPAAHRAFFHRLRLSFETPRFYFVHAGINPQCKLARQKAADLLWIREPFLGSSKTFEKLIIHGHTPVAAPEILCNRVNVDTGAYLTGRLSCAALYGDSVRVLATEPNAGQVLT